ncbi:hypothetical protein BH24GEM3_BH24GEM3_26090 [soil metagenome]|jgi:hypothetical protein|nr:hypothetical protein [Gemmatimonadota bacterium]
MAQPKPLLDEFGVIREAEQQLPVDDLKLAFLRALAELEDNEAHRRQHFPHTNLRRVKGVKQQVYRADVTKGSAWRIHLQYGKDNRLHLKDLLPPTKHDDPTRAVQARRHRYE